jgi:hypothetical protein
MEVDEPVGKGVHEVGRQDAHESGGHDEVRLVGGNLFTQRDAPLLPGGEVLGRDDDRLEPHPRRLVDAGTGPIGGDRNDGAGDLPGLAGARQ